MELMRALGALSEPPSDQTAELCRLLEIERPPAEGEYETAFLFQLYPYASVYLGAEGQIGGEARDRIAGFWRALDLVPPVAPDHLALMLGLYARLVELEESAGAERAQRGWRQARAAFFWEHLASWLPVYLIRMVEIGGRTYAAWAEILLDTLRGEVERLGPPARPPLHLREAPPFDDPRHATDEAPARAFLGQLSSPVRTGFVLVASDLHRAAAELELGLRAGERRFVLEALLSQDAAAALGWLAGFAGASTRRIERPQLEAFEPTRRFWIERCRASAALLGELAADARPASGQGAT